MKVIEIFPSFGPSLICINIKYRYILLKLLNYYQTKSKLLFNHQTQFLKHILMIIIAIFPTFPSPV